MHSSAQNPPKPVSNKPKLPKVPKWTVIKLDYFKQNLKEGATHKFTLGDLAKKHGLSYGHVRNKASEEKWGEELDELLKNKPKMAVEAVKQLSIVNELEVRLRQATISRQAINKALAAIEGIDPSKMEVKDAIALLRLGLENERKALGIPDNVRFEMPKDVGGEQTAVTEAMDLIRRIKEKRKAIEGEFSVDSDGQGS
jgi:hypothetical protein